MKNLFKMVLMFFSAMLIGTFTYSQEEEVPVPEDFKSEIFTPAEMDAKSETFSMDKGWQALTKAVEDKGYKRKKDKDRKGAKDGKGAKGGDDKWGFSASYTENGQKVETFVCMFEYTDSKGETCTAMWAKKGTVAYKAYFTFPPGTKDVTKATPTEMYVDANNQIQRAKSWYTCWSGLITRCRVNSVCTSAVINNCLSQNFFSWFPCVFLAPFACVRCIQFYATYCIGR